MGLSSNIFCCFFIILSSCLHTLDAESATNTTTDTKDSCFEERNGIFPCSSTISGNIILMAFYGGLLGIAAKYISDGAEMLLDFGLPAGIIGGVVLPLLGAVPDAAIIVASGMGDNAQEKIAVGMGTLAGSTVMLLTVAWSASLVVGRCDLNEKNESIDKTLKTPFSLKRQGVTLLPDVKSGIVLMLTTSFLYLVVQSADWHWGATLTGNQPAYVQKAALATFIMCALGLLFYLVFSIFDSKRNERLSRLHREELMKRKVLHTMIMLSKGRGSPAGSAFAPADSTTTTTTTTEPEAAPEMSKKKYFSAWKVKTGTKAINEKLGLLEEEGNGDTDTDADVEAPKAVDKPESPPPSPPENGSKAKAVFKCVAYLVGGFAVVTVFSDPMCEVLTSLTNKHNKSHVPIPPFFISFIVTPFCSNASELVSSLIFASKKTRENITMTYAQIFGAATMNNTLCLGIFMALVYFKDLEWVYGAEVVCILASQWIVGLASLSKTYKLWMGLPVAFTYVVCILIVYLLESQAGWH